MSWPGFIARRAALDALALEPGGALKLAATSGAHNVRFPGESLANAVPAAYHSRSHARRPRPTLDCRRR